MFLLSLPQLLFSNLALFLIADCLRRGSASNLGQNLKSRISPLRIWCKATLLNADGGVTCSPVLYHHCLLEPEGKSLLMSFQIDSNLYEDCWICFCYLTLDYKESSFYNWGSLTLTGNGLFYWRTKDLAGRQNRQLVQAQNSPLHQLGLLGLLTQGLGEGWK